MLFRQLILDKGTLINCLLKNIIYLSIIILSISIFSTFVTLEVDERTFIIPGIKFVKQKISKIPSKYIYLSSTCTFHKKISFILILF